jgi:hypothetical protein
MVEIYGKEEFTLKIDGLEKLQEAFERLPKDVSRRLFKEALFEAGKIWQAEAARTAPQLQEVKLSQNPRFVRIPGYLARHIGIRVSSASDIVQGDVKVGPTKSAFWGLFLEIGRKASAKGSRIVRAGKGRKSGGASFMEARRWFSRAYEAVREKVLSRFVEAGQQILAEEAKKHV